MPPPPDWTFPDLPPHLQGLTLEHLDRLRSLIRAHGRLVGSSPRGDVHGLKLRMPIDVFLIVIGSGEDATLIVAPPGEPPTVRQLNVALTVGGPTRIAWSPNVPLQDILDCLDPDLVIKTSQREKSGKDGTN